MQSADKYKLRSDFIEFMKSRDSLPKKSAVEQWLRKHDSIKTGAMGPLLDGKASSQGNAVKLVRFLLAKGEDEATSHYRHALLDFVQSITNCEPTLSPHSIAELLLEKDEEDYLSFFFDRFLSFFQVATFVGSSVRHCPAKQIPEVLYWMDVTFGKQIGQRKPFTEPKDAVTLAKQVSSTCHEDWLPRVTQWHAYDPWTVVLSTQKRRVVGGAIVLPLKEAAYKDFRNGKRREIDFDAKDLQRPSRFVLLNACFERPKELGGPSHNVTMNLNMTMMNQLAVLTHCAGEEAGLPLHLMSYGTCPVTEHRLQTGGFKKTNYVIPASEFPIYEIVLPWDKPHNSTFYLRAILRGLGTAADSLLQPP